MGEKVIFTPEMVDLIMKILRKGNSAEIKKENNKLVIVEIERRVKNKTSIIGSRETVNRDYELNARSPFSYYRGALWKFGKIFADMRGCIKSVI